MLEILKTYQVTILIGCGLLCLLLAFFVMVIKFNSISKKRALVKIELGVAVLLIADALSYKFQGDTTALSFYMSRISTFLVYMLTAGNIYFLNEYITTLFMSSGRFKKLPKRLLLSFIICSIEMTLVIISQFTGMYYSFSENNMYMRGPLFVLGFIILLIVVIMQFSFVLQHRSIITKGILWAIIIYSILPITTTVIQIFISDVSLINLASCQSAVILFLFVLIDQNNELSKAANTDIPTGLINSYGYIYEVDRVIHFQNITDYNGYYFDIVRMGQINDKYGKSGGDEIIIKYANNIRKEVEKDEIFGRLGGNFFVALIKKSNTEKFLKLLKDVPVEIDFDGKPETLHIAAVAGIYEVTTKNITAGQLLGHTATAVTYAKNIAHQPYIFLDKKLEEELKQIRLTEVNIKKGLLADEFEPFYQPKVNSKNNMLCGAEALVRWKHEGKYISPINFIPIMEKNSSICELDFKILEHVCKDISEWIDRGLEPVTVSVNFSRKNLGNPILAEAIYNIVKKYNIPENLIQVEITETIDEYPMTYLIGVVEALQRYGITVAIDDFGTGSSSIGLLKATKFDVLKIDKSFVDWNNEKEKQLLQDIISMAHNLGLEVIAEGVEDKNKVDELKYMKCFKIQGYVFDKPLEKAEYEKKLADKLYS